MTVSSSHLTDPLRRAEQSAGGIDVLATAGADGGEDAVGCEVVAQLFHPRLVSPMEGHVGNLVEADEVDAAVEALEQGYDLAGVGRGVVDAAEDDILKR